MSAPQKPRSAWSAAVRYTDLGMRLVVTSAVFTLAGFGIDRRWHPTGRFPLATLLGFAIGLTGGMVALFRGASALTKRERGPSAGGPREGER